MYIDLDFVMGPFVIVFFICWFAFSLLIVFRPHLWFEYQNKMSKPYGYKWMVTDEAKFRKTHKSAGILLIAFGITFAIILLGGLL